MAYIIASKSWWTLDSDGLLNIYDDIPYYTSFQVFGRTYPSRKAHYSDKKEASPDFLPLWEAPLKASKIQPEF